MKSLMLKLLILSSLSVFAFGDVISFIKNSMKKNDIYELQNAEIYLKKPLKEPKGWSANFVKLQIKLKKHNRSIVQRDIIFSNGDFYATDLISAKNNKSIKPNITPDIDKFYDKEHLIEGKFDAKHKIAIFSDPVCPFCIDFVPEIIDLAKKRNDIAIFYYHLPLISIHPSALTLSKAMMATRKKGILDVELKTYKAFFELTTSDEDEILSAFNEKLNTNITKDDIKKEEQSIQKDLEIAEFMMVNSTPTFFVDGKLDDERKALTKLKENK